MSLFFSAAAVTTFFGNAKNLLFRNLMNYCVTRLERNIFCRFSHFKNFKKTTIPDKTFVTSSRFHV